MSGDKALRGSAGWWTARLSRSQVGLPQIKAVGLPDRLLFRCVDSNGVALTPAVRKGQSVRLGDLLAQDGPNGSLLYAPLSGSVQDVRWEVQARYGYHALIELRPDSPPGPATTSAAGQVQPGTGDSRVAQDERDQLAQAAALAGMDWPAALDAAYLVINACEPDAGVASRTAWLRHDFVALARTISRLAQLRGARPTVLVAPVSELNSAKGAAAADALSPASFLPGPASAPWGQDALLARFAQKKAGWAVRPLVIGVEQIALMAQRLGNDPGPGWVVLTVGGGAVQQPGLYRAPIGCRVSDVLATAGLDAVALRELVRGGLLTGESLRDPEDPVGVTDLAFWALSREESRRALPAVGVCVRCGRCVQACPVGLVPHQIARLARADRWEDARAVGVDSCELCGLCAYVCPSQLPLISLIRLAQQQLRPRAQATDVHGSAPRSPEAERSGSARSTGVQQPAVGVGL